MKKPLVLTLILAVLAVAVLSLFAPTGLAAPFAYIPKSGAVSKVDLATNTVTATVDGFNHPYGVAAAPDGKRIYVSDLLDNSVSVIDTTTNRVTATIPVGVGPRGLAVTPDRSRVYVACPGDNNVYVINTATNTVSTKVPIVDAYSVVVHPDGTRVYVARDRDLAHDNDFVLVIDTATNTLIDSIEAGRHPRGIDISPDGSRVYVANFWSDSVTVIATSTNSEITSVPVGRYPIGVAVSSDGKRVYVTNSYSDTVSVLATATNTVIATVNVGAYPYGVDVAPDGRKVVVANQDGGSISIINTATNAAATVPVGSIPQALGRFIVPPLPVVTVKAVDPKASEPGTDKGKFVIKRTGNTGKPLTVYYKMAGTAKNGIDYRKLSGKLVIPKGKASASFYAQPIDDRAKERSEMVKVTLAKKPSYQIGKPASATVTVADND